MMDMRMFQTQRVGVQFVGVQSVKRGRTGCIKCLLNQQRRKIQAKQTVQCAQSAAPVYKENESNGVSQFLNAFWKFLRPHTIRGTVLGSCAVTARCLLENPGFIDWSLLPKAVLGVLALLLGNGYIVGINQIFDIQLDEVNKPFLPLAAKELTPFAAWLLCITLATAGIALTIKYYGPFISSLYAFGLFLGTIYSVPPFKLKRFAVPAFLIIATVRGFLLNFGVYYATRAALGLQFAWSPAIVFITCFVTVFATTIALTKDLYDVEGDKQFGINTMATQLGVKNMAKIGTGLLLMNYIGAIGYGLKLGSSVFNLYIMVGVHAVLGIILINRMLVLDKQGYDRTAVQQFYRWVWNLFYTEYALFPFL